ncbi:hypothetical protein F4778DRAFT_789794 [Xylariomycetidae sp. FL2044]|nr:hypothetical protein F4778DRAFT_789794 [Xylariomycetidae sp. FL2044]
MGPSLPASTTVDASYSTLPLPTPGEEREPSLLPTPIEEQPDASFMHLSEFSPEELARFEAALMAETDREHHNVPTLWTVVVNHSLRLVLVWSMQWQAPRHAVWNHPRGPHPHCIRKLLQNQNSHQSPQAILLPRRARPEQDKQELGQEANHQAKLEQAIISGEMPQFCVPEYHEYSEKPGHVTAIKVLSRDENDRPTAYEMIKKSLGPKDDKSQWNQVLLCNPCGIWFSSSDPIDAGEVGKGSGSAQPTTKKEKPGAAHLTVEEGSARKVMPSQILRQRLVHRRIPLDRWRVPCRLKDATSNAFDRERFGDNISEKGSGKGRQRVKAVVECQGSTHSRGSGTPASPITLTMGLSADKENTNVTDQTQKMDEDDFADLFGTPFRPSTPPPKSAIEALRAIHNLAEPAPRPKCHPVAHPDGPDTALGPAIRPSIAAFPAPLELPRRTVFRVAADPSINQLLSEADSFVMPPSPARFRGPAGSSGHPYHRRMAGLQIDFDSLPNWDSDEIQRRLETQHYDFGNLLSTDGSCPTSPPALLKHYNTQQQHSGLPPPVFGIGTEANTLNANGVGLQQQQQHNLNGDGRCG